MLHDSFRILVCQRLSHSSRAVVAVAGILHDWSTSPDGDTVTRAHLSWIALAMPSHMARVW